MAGPIVKGVAVGVEGLRVSVIMAAYNAARFLDDSIRSVLHQTIDDFELMVIDDASTDGSRALAEGYAGTDSRIRVLSTGVNSGQNAARIQGIGLARGAWLAMIDADDAWTPEKLAKQLLLAETDPGLVVIGSNCLTMSQSGQHLAEHRYPTRHRRLFRNLDRHRRFPPHSSMLMRREATHQVGGYNARFVNAPDRDLTYRLSEVGKLGLVAEPLVRIRKHSGSLSEGSGFRPEFAIAASVCHWLRVWGHPDPSRELDEPAWDAFMEWVRRQAEEAGLSAPRAALQKIRRDEHSHPRSWRRLRLGAAILRSGRAIPIVVQRWWGLSLPTRLAREWAGRSGIKT